MDPLFIYTGPESGERNDAIEKFRKDFGKKAGDLDCHTLYAGETTVNDVLTLLQNGSLFAAARFVVLRNAELIKTKEEIEQISSWQKATQKAGTDDAVLFLVSDETGIDKRLEALASKENKKIFWEMFEDRKEKWLFEFFRKNGFQIAQSAVELILDLIENNTEALRNECSRFFSCFDKTHVITADDVNNILSHNREESPFTLFEALCETSKTDTERFETALLILQKIRQSKESNAIQLIAGLTYCFRMLRTWHKVNLEYPSEFELKKAGFTSKTRQQQYARGAKIWNDNQASACLALLSESDNKIRSLGNAVEDTVLQTMLYAIVLKRGLPLLEYKVTD